jgi:predicted Ser/Thr protein kinase
MSDATVRRSVPAPARIGRYEIIDRIGRGSMGTVYSARDTNMDRRVAVKVMMADVEDDPELRSRFFREAKAAGSLLHPNIVTVFDIGEDGGRPFIVMELLEGENLATLVAKNAELDLEVKVDLLIQLCEGLSAAHARGVCHRDVKPANLFITRDGTLKILDFGIARIAASTLTATGLMVGTPEFMSPEQARGAEIDQRSDLFAVGAVAYFLLTGRAPFAARDLPAVLRKVESEAPAPIPEAQAPAALSKILNRALEKRSADRYQLTTDLLADLVRFKQQYERESAGVAARARDAWMDLERLLAECHRTAREIGCDADVERDVAGIGDIAARFPAVREHGADAIAGGLLPRRGLEDVWRLLLDARPERERKARALAERAAAAVAARIDGVLAGTSATPAAPVTDDRTVLLARPNIGKNA